MFARPQLRHTTEQDVAPFVSCAGGAWLWTSRTPEPLALAQVLVVSALRFTGALRDADIKLEAEATPIESRHSPSTTSVHILHSDYAATRMRSNVETRPATGCLAL